MMPLCDVLLWMQMQNGSKWQLYSHRKLLRGCVWFLETPNGVTFTDRSTKSQLKITLSGSGRPYSKCHTSVITLWARARVSQSRRESSSLRWPRPGDSISPGKESEKRRRRVRQKTDVFLSEITREGVCPKSNTPTYTLFEAEMAGSFSLRQDRVTRQTLPTAFVINYVYVHTCLNYTITQLSWINRNPSLSKYSKSTYNCIL